MERVIKKQSKEELLKQLKNCGKITDTEGAHIEADEILLKIIDDEQVTKIWNKISAGFWYA